MRRSGIATRFSAGVLALGLIGMSSLAQPPRPPLDPLAEAQARQKIADQKAESEVKNAIQDAERLAKTNRIKGVQYLKTAQNNVDISAAISSDARRSLTEMLNAKIAQFEGRPVVANPSQKIDPAAPGLRLDRQTTFEKSTAELKAVNEGIQRIVRFKNAGRNQEAEREVAALAKVYPNNPAVIRLQEQDTLASRVEDAQEFARMQERRITLALNDVARSSVPLAGDVEFPKNWKEITKRRLSGIKLTEKEKKLVEALNKPVNVDINNRMLEEALQELSNQIDQNLFIDKKSLADLEIDLRKPVSLQAKGISARTALRQLLFAQGLTFVVKDEAIQVVTVDRARDLLVTRVYYLGDLAQGIGPFGGVTAGPLNNLQQTLQNVDVIIKAIVSSVDPLCWKEKGGPCTITFHYPSMSLIIRASAEVHSTLGSTFSGGK